MKTQSLRDALEDDTVAGVVYVVSDRQVIYTGSTTKSLRYRLNRHRTFGKHWALRNWMAQLTTSGLTRASVEALTPEEVRDRLNLSETPTLRAAEIAYQRKCPPLLCVAWATSATTPPLFEMPTEAFDDNAGLTPEGRKKR